MKIEEIKFRIREEEFENGTKHFCPEIYYNEVHIFRNDKWKWGSLNNFGDIEVVNEIKSWWSYKTFDEALKAINDYKETYKNKYPIKVREYIYDLN